MSMVWVGMDVVCELWVFVVWVLVGVGRCGVVFGVVGLVWVRVTGSGVRIW